MKVPMKLGWNCECGREAILYSFFGYDEETGDDGLDACCPGCLKLADGDCVCLPLEGNEMPRQMKWWSYQLGKLVENGKLPAKALDVWWLEVERTSEVHK